MAAGRLRDAVGVATQIWYVAFGSPAEVRAAEEELCERWAGIPYRPLDRSPYLLFGSPAQMAEALTERREAYGLQRISLSGESGIAAAPAGSAPVLPRGAAPAGLTSSNSASEVT